MKVFFKLTAFVLLTLWFPATQHCDLEAAGVELVAHQPGHASAACSEVCTEDACHNIEDISFAKTCSHLRVLPPASTLQSCLLGLLLAPALIESEPAVQPRDPPEIQALHRTWSFVRRTALPVRAPNFVA